MIIVTEVRAMKEIAAELKAEGKSLGLVPTMGYLHEGHESLIKKAVSENDVSIVSIFVNPLQFGPKEDLKAYPKDFEKDKAVCEQAGASYIFKPEAGDMYPEDFYTSIDMDVLTEGLCGRSRPKHFKGVLTVVNKLFNISRADRAYFGKKDIQQLQIVKKMVEDLNMNIEIIGCETVREEDGLAKSSRNVYLSSEERQYGSLIKESLDMAKNAILSEGIRDSKKIKDLIEKHLENIPQGKIDYIEIVDEKNLKDKEVIQGKIIVAIAVFIGNTRLIDNITLDAL